MERSSLSNSLKDHSIGSKASNNNNNNNRVKYSWNYGEDYLGGFSWPPRSYTCSFCKTEFRSAQALGGHMNVHRRDRARLRQSPPRDTECPILNLNINPNPNPSSLSSSSFTCTLPNSMAMDTPPLPPLSSPSCASSSKWAIDDIPFLDPVSPKKSELAKTETGKSFSRGEEFDGCKFLEKADEIVRLDLEIGVVSDSKEDLDLELRLGYS